MRKHFTQLPRQPPNHPLSHPITYTGTDAPQRGFVWKRFRFIILIAGGQVKRTLKMKRDELKASAIHAHTSHNKWTN